MNTNETLGSRLEESLLRHATLLKGTMSLPPVSAIREVRGMEESNGFLPLPSAYQARASLMEDIAWYVVLKAQAHEVKWAKTWSRAYAWGARLCRLEAQRLEMAHTASALLANQSI